MRRACLYLLSGLGGVSARINVEDPAYVENPVPQGVPDAPCNPDPPRYLARIPVRLNLPPEHYVLCLLAALTLLITRQLLVVLDAAALMAGTIVGFVLARTVGIFGFHLTFSSGLAWTVLIAEAAGVLMLLLTAALIWQRR
jgi:hypothetical protein